MFRYFYMCETVNTSLTKCDYCLTGAKEISKGLIIQLKDFWDKLEHRVLSKSHEQALISFYFASKESDDV